MTTGESYRQQWLQVEAEGRFGASISVSCAEIGQKRNGWPRIQWLNVSKKVREIWIGLR